MSTEGSNCEVLAAEKNYPLTQLPLACPVPTPSLDTSYVERGYIDEDIMVVTGMFLPVNSPTPTPSYTPTNTPTPSFTPTATSTPGASPTPTPTVTPTGTPAPTPTPTHLPRYVFTLEVSISIDVEAVVYVDLILKTVTIYHAVEGAFPRNPVFLQWSVTKDGVIEQQGQAYWTIIWRLTPAPVPRLRLLNYKEDAAKYGKEAATITGAAVAAVGIYAGLFSGASSGMSVGVYAIGVFGVAALAAIAVGLIIFALFKLFGNKKPPPPKPYPQYSNTFELPKDLIIPLDNFKLNSGTVPAHVYDGGVTVEVAPTARSRFITAINLIDLTPTRSSTTDSYRFQISTSNY